MSLKIKFKPTKTHHQIVVADSRKAVYGKSIDKLGFYTRNPINEKKYLHIDTNKFLYWVSVGAKPTESLMRLIIRSGLINSDVIRLIQ